MVVPDSAYVRSMLYRIEKDLDWGTNGLECAIIKIADKFSSIVAFCRKKIDFLYRDLQCTIDQSLSDQLCIINRRFTKNPYLVPDTLDHEKSPKVNGFGGAIAAGRRSVEGL